MKLGIVGLPNVGKSTLFKALTRKQVDAQNYPFCTIEPNVGVVIVPDERIDKLSELFNSKKTIYNTIEFVDIAGLVEGASKGEGLGNKFLASIRECDAILEVVRDFEDKDITHVAGKIDPASDVDTIHTELILADMQTVEKRIAGMGKKAAHSKDKDIVHQLEVFNKVKGYLDDGKMIYDVEFGEEELEVLADLHLLSRKPIIFALNFDEGMISDKGVAKKHVQDFQTKMVIKDDSFVLPICAKLEADLAELSDKESKEYLEEMGLERTGLDNLILKSYETLKLITMLTTGEDETKGWNIKTGTKAPQAAGKIHTDFEKGFICADVINWQELIGAGSEATAKEKGMIRMEGKEYIVKDGDVCVFKFNR